MEENHGSLDGHKMTILGINIYILPQKKTVYENESINSVSSLLENQRSFKPLAERVGVTTTYSYTIPL